MASTYLTRTLVNSNQKKFTISVWLKRSKLGSQQSILGVGGGGAYATHLYFDGNDRIDFWNYFNSAYQGRKTTNRKFRDTNAWYHIVAAVDTTSAQSTADDRMKIYVNGVRETSLSTSSNPNQDQTFEFSSASVHQIGRNSGGDEFDGCMSHFHFVDGSQLEPTVFGETDATTGEWKIITSPSYTAGTNGFWVLKDGNSVTDSSTNSNDFTVAAGTLTKSEDNPSNVFATFNNLHNYYEGGTYAYGNNQITTGGSNKYTWNNSTIGMEAGKYYAEFKWVSGGTDILFGLTDKYTSSSTGELGNYDKQYAYRTNGTVRNNNGDLGGWSGSTWTTGDVVGVLLDMDNHKLYFSKNGVIQNSSTGISISTSPEDGCYYFSSCGYDDASCVLQANFGNGVFGNTALTGTTYNGADGNGIFKYDPNSITLDSTSKSFKSLSTKGLNA